MGYTIRENSYPDIRFIEPNWKDLIHNTNYNDVSGPIFPYENEIERIYRGYRQCYSKKPFMDKQLSSDRIEYLCNEFRKEYQYREFLCDLLGCDEDQLDEYAKHNPYFSRFLNMCMFIVEHMNHESQLEHATITYQIDGFDRADSHQYVRSRIASFGQASQRYIDYENIPMNPTNPIRDNEKAMNIVDNVYGIISTGVSALKELADPNIKNEDIRGIFPNNTCTALVCTMNFRELLHVFSERCCVLTQERYRYIANTILGMLRTRIPFIFRRENGVGAKCEKYHVCPEDKKRSCGKYPNINDVKYFIDEWRRVIDDPTLMDEMDRFCGLKGFERGWDPTK